MAVSQETHHAEPIRERADPRTRRSRRADREPRARATPGRRVVSLPGDGGLAMMMGSFVSLSQRSPPVGIACFNEGSLAFVAMAMEPGDDLGTGTDLHNPDVTAVADASGIEGVRVEDADDSEEAPMPAFARPGPVLADAVAAQRNLVTPPPVRPEQAKGFSLCMLEAIIHRRGGKVVELARINLLR